MKKLHKLLLLSIPLLFGAFLLFMIHYSTQYAAEHEEVEHLHSFYGGRFALIKKECTESVGSDTVYKLHLIGRLGASNYFTLWAEYLNFVPSLKYIQDCKNPFAARWYKMNESSLDFSFYHQQYLVVCSKEDYDSVQVGDYIGVEGTYDDQTPENGMVVLTRQKGPLFNHPDGLILWLYRSKKPEP